MLCISFPAVKHGTTSKDTRGRKLTKSVTGPRPDYLQAQGFQKRKQSSLNLATSSKNISCLSGDVPYLIYTSRCLDFIHV